MVSIKQALSDKILVIILVYSFFSHLLAPACVVFPILSANAAIHLLFHHPSKRPTHHESVTTLTLDYVLQSISCGQGMKQGILSGEVP
jgi:hypothetical protein